MGDTAWQGKNGYCSNCYCSKQTAPYMSFPIFYFAHTLPSSSNLLILPDHRRRQPCFEPPSTELGESALRWPQPTHPLQRQLLAPSFKSASPCFLLRFLLCQRHSRRHQLNPQSNNNKEQQRPRRSQFRCLHHKKCPLRKDQPSLNPTTPTPQFPKRKSSKCAMQVSQTMK